MLFIISSVVAQINQKYDKKRNVLKGNDVTRKKFSWVMLIVFLWNRINNFDNVIILGLLQPRCLLRRNRGRRWRITRYVNAASSCCHRSCHWSCRNLAAATADSTVAAHSAATAAHGHSCRRDGGLVDALLHVALQDVASLELPAAEWTGVAGADPTLVALVTDQSSLKRKIY